MNFALSEDQLMFKSTIRKLFDQHEQTVIARDFAKGKQEDVAKIYTKLSELGATAVPISEQYDGMELGMLDVLPVFEEVGRVLYPTNFAETVAFAARVIEKYGSESQKQAYLPNIAAGEHVFSLAWLEPQKTYSNGRIDTIIRESGDVYKITGVKTMVPTLLVSHLLIAAIDEADKQVLCIVPIEDVEVRALNSFDQTTPLAEITLNEVTISSENILVDERALAYGLQSLHAAISAIQVGAMDRLVEMTSEYAKIREQFGQPVGRFQAVKHKLADMKIELEIARSLSHYASWAVDTNANDCEEAVYSARVYCTEAFLKTAAESVQLHGGIGFTEELDCHLYVKRSRFYEHYLGTISEHNEKIAVALNL